MYNYNIDRKERYKSMITENSKRLEFENLQDAMKTAKTLLKNGYQVYMNIEDDLGDGKIIVVIEYEWLDEELADGHYIYQTFEDEARIEAEIRQKRNKETNEDYIWGHEEGYQEGYDAGYDKGWQEGRTAGYIARKDEEDTDNFDADTPLTLCDDNDDNDDGNYSSWSEEHRRWFDAGYDEGYETAKYDFCDCPEED